MIKKKELICKMSLFFTLICLQTTLSVIYHWVVCKLQVLTARAVNFLWNFNFLWMSGSQTLVLSRRQPGVHLLFYFYPTDHWTTSITGSSHVASWVCGRRCCGLHRDTDPLSLVTNPTTVPIHHECAYKGGILTISTQESVCLCEANSPCQSV